MYEKNLILNKTRCLSLPLKVTSTAFQLANILRPYFKETQYFMQLDEFSKIDLISNVCIFLSCKFEDIHGVLGKIISTIPNSNLEETMKFEEDILQFLDFKFLYLNIYQYALGIKLQLDEIKDECPLLDNNKNLEWNYIVENLDKIFSSDIFNDMKYSLKEMVLGSFLINMIISEIYCLH